MFITSKSDLSVLLWRITAPALLVLLFFAVHFDIVSGNSAAASRFLRIEHVPDRADAMESAGEGSYLLTFSGATEVRLTRESSVPLFYLDILGASVEVNPFVMNFSRGPVKLVRLNQVSSDPLVLRATFFLQRQLIPHVESSVAAWR